MRLSVTTFEFLVAVFAAAAVFPLLKPLWLRQALIVGATGVFIWLQEPEPAQLLTLLGFVLSGYAAGRLLARRPNGLVLTLYIVSLTIAFVILKRYDFLRLVAGDTLISHALDLVGLSFIFFRQIHYVVDVKQGEIRDFDLIAYLCYQLNPFTLLAGPIQRFQRFSEDWAVLKPLPGNAHALRMIVLRLLLGVIKVVVLAELCLWLAFNPPGVEGLPAQLMKFYLFPAYVYFNFVGYCDIVIAGAALFGLRVPENFDRPYLARNMIDYWTRWHRTLSFWIRDYIFTPTYMALARSWPRLAPHLVFLCYFVALFLAGVWHGATWNFVIFGLLNGAGVSAAKLWENAILARSGRKGLKAYLENQPIKWAARVATIHFVCVTMIFLRPESTDQLAFWSNRVLEMLRPGMGG